MPASMQNMVVEVSTPAGPVRIATDVTATGASRMLRYARALAEPHLRPHLSPREKQLLVRLADGMSYKQIAGDLEISLETVRTYVRSLYRKLGAHSIAEALQTARSLALI
jgi:DNA-binding CsgD family transcriptional regulator